MIMEDNTKKIKAFRGSARMKDDGTFTFQPDGKGESRQSTQRIATPHFVPLGQRTPYCVLFREKSLSNSKGTEETSYLCTRN
jgi:hypothetical protein